MHCSGNYFSKVEESDADLEVPAGTAGKRYLQMLEAWLPHVCEASQPDLVFYQAGVDVFSADRLVCVFYQAGVDVFSADRLV